MPPLEVSSAEMSDIRNALSRLENSTGRMEGLLSGFQNTVAAIQQGNDQGEEQRKDLELRTRKLELNQSRWAGGAAIIAMIGSWLSYHVWPWH